MELLKLIALPIFLSITVTVKDTASLQTNGVPGISLNKVSNDEDSSEDRIYVLFVGLSGCGKSTTINVLFNTSIAPEGNSESTTFEIQEYSVKLIDDSRELRIIDTPGMEDTGGLENDAQFLATLEKYLEEKELSYRTPDVVVLVCARFDDNRFSGESSKFVKMLRGLSLLREKIIEGNNVVFLLTHLMGADENDTSSPAGKKARIEKTIKDHTLFPSPIRIVVGENKGEDQELDRVELGYQLPNGEVYPYNLCESIKQILINSTKQNFWSRTCSWNSSLSKTVKLVSQFSLLPKEDSRSLKMLQFLTAANIKTEETEISMKLNQTWNNLPGKENFPSDTLVYLQKALHLRFITKLSDIPKTDADIAALFRSIGRANEIAVILKESFGIKMPTLPFDTLLGNGFDIIQDDTLTSTPFEIIKSSPRHIITELGYFSPSGVITTVNSYKKTFCTLFETENEYLKHRAFMLGIENAFYSSSNFAGNLKPGFNIRSRNAYPSLYIEFRTLKFELGNAEFSSAFISILKDLQDFNATSLNSIRNWDRFLKMYGTHIVHNSYGGGSIEFLFQDNLYNSLDLNEIASNIKSGDSDIPPLDFNNATRLKISGGDQHLYSENANVFFGGGKKSMFNSWKDSVHIRPTILQNDLKLKSTTELLRTSNFGLLADKMEKAINFFFKEQLEDISISTEETLKKENAELIIRMDSITNEKSTCVTEKSTLTNMIEKMQLEKSQLESSTMEVSQELSKTKQLLGEANINLAGEKSTSLSLLKDIQGCQISSTGFKKELEIERSHIQELKLIVATTQSKVNVLQSNELSLQGQLNTCNGRQCNEWFTTSTLCFEWFPDGNGGQCAGSSRRLCAPVNQMTPYYRDDTDRRGGGCQIRWGLMSPNAPSWAVAGIRICYKWYADGNRGQCNWGEGSGQTCSSIGQYTSFYRDDTDKRGGGCQMSWMLQVPQDSPAWLLRVTFCFNWYADGNGGQCNNGHGGGTFCAQANTWTSYYRDDTDKRGGGCQMSWGIKY